MADANGPTDPAAPADHASPDGPPRATGPADDPDPAAPRAAAPGVAAQEVPSPARPPRAPPSPFSPPPVRLRLTVSAVAVVLFALIAADVHFDGGLTYVDRAVGEWVYENLESGERQRFRHEVSTIGDDLVVVVVMILGMVSVAAMGRWRTAAFMGVSAGMERLVVWTLKAYFAEERPLAIIAGEDTTLLSHSFPSGHAAVSMVWYGLLIYFLLYAHVSRSRRPPGPYILPAVALWVLISLVAGVARVAGGVHWPSDVLASWAMGVAWLGVSIHLHETWIRPFEQLAVGRRPTNEAVL